MRQFVSLGPTGLRSDFDHATEGAQPIVDVRESATEITIAYRFPGFYRAEDERLLDGKPVMFEQVDMDAVGHLAASGKPLLPSFGRYVQVPDGYQVELGGVRTSAPVTVEDCLVLPSQGSATDAIGEEPVFDFDRATYSRDEPYPRELVELSGPFELDGYRAILLHVRPVQHNPQRRLLVAYGNLDVCLKLVERESLPLPFHPDDSREAFGNLFLNPRRKRAKRNATSQSPSPPAVRTEPELLIIHAARFAKAARQLADWKNRRGLVTELVGIDQIGDEVSRLKTFLRGRRHEPRSRLRYVLLFGDAADIVTESLPEGGGEHNSTDYYYSTPADPASATEVKLPWLALGRIPARNVREAQDIVSKIIAYERKPPANPAYYRRAVCAAYFQGNHPNHQDERAYLQTMERVWTFLDSLGFHAARVYVSDDPKPQRYADGTRIPAKVIAAMLDNRAATRRLVAAVNKGCLFIAHRDHGDTNGWYRPTFTDQELDRITSAVPSMFYSINCLTGAWPETTKTECFAEKALGRRGAAPSLIAATEVSNTWLNNYLIKALFDAMYGGLIRTFPGTTVSYPVRNSRLGDVLNYAKSYLPTVASGAEVKDHLEIYHVLGDPTLELWRDVPRALELEARLSARTLNLHLSECPAGAVITLWAGARLLKRIQPTSTRVAVPTELLRPAPRTRAPRPKTVDIACWAPGCRCVETRVPLGALAAPGQGRCRSARK
jgi:hypothetical protein